MKPLKQFFIVAALALTCVAAAQLEPNSFITRPVHTHSALMAHVKSSDVVMDRYMRHFRMTRDEVLAYLSTLKPARLEREYACVQYSVPGSGEVKSRHCVVKKGELVFVDSRGVPVLRMKCGNPLTDGPKELIAPVESENIVADTPSLKELVASTQPTLEETVVLYEPPVPTLLPEPPVAPPIDAVPSSAPTTNITEALGIAVVGAGLSVNSGNGGNTPVPEPASLAALTVGAATLISRRKRNRR